MPPCQDNLHNFTNKQLAEFTLENTSLQQTLILASTMNDKSLNIIQEAFLEQHPKIHQLEGDSDEDDYRLAREHACIRS